MRFVHAMSGRVSLTGPNLPGRGCAALKN